MNTQEASFDVDDQALDARLAATPDLDLGRDGRLVRHPANPLRDDRARRLVFEWVCAEGTRYNLIAGPGVADEYARVRAFHQAYPDLGIRPVALIPVDGGSVAVLEHFEGRSLEQTLADGTLTPDRARELLEQLLDRLEASAVPAGMDALHAELESLRADLHACPVLGAMDLHFFDAVVFPYLRATCEPSYLRQRWTTGDFIARNLLVNARGELRLIDCEFAVRSVLSPADFQRFGEFSEVPASLCEQVRRRLPGDPRWWRIHFCLDQACKLGKIRRPDAFAPHAPALLHRIWRDLQSDPAARPASCLLGFLDDLDRLARHAEGLQVRYDELLTHANDLQDHTNELQKHTHELQVRYDELLAHSHALQGRYNDLLAHSNALQGHYDALARHTRDLQSAYDALAGKKR